MLTKEDIVQALKKYDSIKYSEEFYSYYLEKISRAFEPNDQLKDCVRYLILWFLGKVTKERPDSFIERVYVNEKKFFILKTTPNNERAIESACDNINLWAGLSFKNNHLPFNNFIQYADTITKNSIVLPSFYVHMFKPNEYPILNGKVWKVYIELMNKNVYINTKPAFWSHYHQYVNFCLYLKETLNLSLREIDKGLWVLGDELKTKAREEEKNLIDNQYMFDGVFEDIKEQEQ